MRRYRRPASSSCRGRTARPTTGYRWGTLKAVGDRGAASIEGHGSGGWPLGTVTEELRASDAYVRDRLAQL
ncbi:MAG TPA: hypothetical protein VGO94_08355 [Mycobacteriales bacterium]|nr:hypothetical protein [Mycobacteriales bacterium]